MSMSGQSTPAHETSRKICRATANASPIPNVSKTNGVVSRLSFRGAEEITSSYGSPKSKLNGCALALTKIDTIHLKFNQRFCFPRNSVPNTQEETPTPDAPAPAATGETAAAAAAAAATAAAAVVTATDAAAAAEASRLAKRVERFGRIAPVTETEAAAKLAKRREKFGLPEPVGASYGRRNHPENTQQLAQRDGCGFEILHSGMMGDGGSRFSVVVWRDVA